MLIHWVCLLQVDLFFYRDPEEAKEQEEEAPAQDFAAITDYTAPEQWSADQWTSDVAAPPAATVGDWGAAPGLWFIPF